MGISSLNQLEKHLTLTQEERNWFSFPSTLPLLVSEHVMSLINKDDPEDPIRKQFIPTCFENMDDLGNLDPLEEEKHSETKRLIHRYANRAALLTTDRCFSYCRHCFRRRFTSNSSGPISEKELEDAAEYLAEHKEIKEVLLTGGDMFTLSDEHIAMMLKTLKEARADIIYRLCTRAIATYPERFTKELFETLEGYNWGAPYYLMTQFNHPREITSETEGIIASFLKLGIIPMNQAVLLKGVNDSVDVLEELSNKLLATRIKPYYLFQGDLVNGTEHLRVKIEHGLEMEKELRKRLSGLAMPQYTIDLPEGGGKVILTHDYTKRHENGKWIFTSPYGGSREYPEKE